jgi:hypothetical protein
MIWDIYPGSGFFHSESESDPNPGYRGQKSTGSRIRNTEDVFIGTIQIPVITDQ